MSSEDISSSTPESSDASARGQPIIDSSNTPPTPQVPASGTDIAPISISTLTQHQYGPYSKGELAEVGIHDVENLVALFREHIKGSGRADVLKGPAADLVWPVCVTLVVGPHDMGVGRTPSPLREATERLLAAGANGTLPEAEVCWLWLTWAASNESPPAANAARLMPLAREPLWGPVHSLAHRALAFFGLRREMGDSLPKSGRLSLYEGDAWMEASHVSSVVAGSASRITSISTDPLPEDIIRKWRVLLDVEADLATKTDTIGSAEAEL